MLVMIHVWYSSFTASFLNCITKKNSITLLFYNDFKQKKWPTLEDILNKCENKDLRILGKRVVGHFHSMI